LDFEAPGDGPRRIAKGDHERIPIGFYLIAMEIDEEATQQFIVVLKRSLHGVWNSIPEGRRPFDVRKDDGEFTAGGFDRHRLAETVKSPRSVVKVT
tara:strand:+ start:233 stop:520 length:288 start_codon:yes stop_codon:yes gene_type:complete